MDKITIRDARREDCVEINRLIKELAEYLECPNDPALDENNLEEDGFLTKHPYFECIVAEVSGDDIDSEMLVGYALYYYTYSTWRGKAIYLEDLYVMPDYRKLGVGSTLFASIAERGCKSGCKKMDFLVMDQSPAGDFYKSKGAIDITEEEGWHHFRLSREAMENLSQETATEVTVNGKCK